jgi:hypothetical protein
MDNNDRNTPATKGDVEDAVNRAKDEVLEAVRGIETKLLNAFYGYAKTNDKRVLEVEGNETIIRGRMAVLEARVLALEEKSNTPPAA